MSHFIISKTIVNDFCQFAKRKGINLESEDYNELFKVLTDGNIEMVPYDLYAKVYNFVLTEYKDIGLGLHEGEQHNMAALGIVGQLIQVSSTIREAIQNSCTYFNLLSNAISINFIEEETTFKIIFKTNGNVLDIFPIVTNHLIHSSMVFSFKEIFFLTLQKEFPIAVHLTSSQLSRKELQRIFKTQVKTNAKQNLLVFDNKLLDLPITTANYELMSVLVDVACSKLKTQTETDKTLSTLITQLIYKLLDPKIPNLKTVAQNLNMSERNLQRKLKEEGTTYSHLIESIKKKLVMDYMKKDLSIKEISFLMGYSEPTAFVSAFKRWYFLTPGEYRKSI